MTTTIALLNALIDGVPCATPSALDARKALLAIEMEQLAVSALRQLIEHPRNAESFAHATRVLKRIDDYVAKHTQAHPVSLPSANMADDLV